MRRRLAIILTAFCAGAGPGRAVAQQLRDSAGVRIADNPRPTLPADRMWRVSAQPILSIGTASDDTVYEFLRINGLVRLSDGRLVVANDGSLTLRFFDSEGTYLHAAGRDGAGPGEFRQILGLRRLRGDSLAVVDLNRINIFSAEGEYARTVTLNPGGHRVWPWVIFQDGSYVGILRASTAVERTPRAGRWTDSVTLVRIGPDPGQSDSLGRFPSEQSSYSQAFRSAAAVVFGPRPYGEASAEEIYLGYSDRPEIRVVSPDGQLRRLIRWNTPRRVVTASARDEYRQRLRAAPGEDGREAPPRLRELHERRARELEFAEYLPAFSALLVDRTGHLWAREYEPWEDAPDRSGRVSVPTPPARTRWNVFSPAGAWLGGLELPPRFTPFEAGADYVLGIARDQDDVEYVRLYGLTRP